MNNLKKTIQLSQIFNKNSPISANPAYRTCSSNNNSYIGDTRTH